MPKQLIDAIVRSRRYLSVFGQLALVVLSNRLAFALRFDGGSPDWALAAFVQTIPWLIAIRGFVFLPFGLYQGLWRYASISDLQAIVVSVAASSIAFAAFTLSPLGPNVYPRSILIIDAVLLILMLGGIRLARRVYAHLPSKGPGKRILIYGAGDAGELVVRDMRANPKYGYAPIGFVDDDSLKRGRIIHGVTVLGSLEDLPRLTQSLRPDEVLLAIPSADAARMREIVRALEPFKVPIKTVPKLRDVIDGNFELNQIRSLDIEDVLAREPVKLDATPLRRLVRGRRILVTGAGGSIGSELCRQIVDLDPASLVMLDRYENSLHAVRLELENRHSRSGLVPVIADVTDADRMRELFDRHNPEIVFHAAAHKHVPLMEENPCEAIKNNVRGTRVLAETADRAGVDRFIMISTDKAVNPTSVMGASKRIAELVVQAQAQGSGTSFCTVRFGNVLGSNGSVVPYFLEQIRRGGPVTVTHPDMRRFFMLIPEAVQLVLHAASQAEGGAIYVLEMGEQIKLLDVARNLIRLSGLVPEEDIEIEFIGLRPGEKLYEELVGAGESAGPSKVPKIQRVTTQRPPLPALADQVRVLEAHAASNQSKAVLDALRDLIPEYGVVDEFAVQQPAAPTTEDVALPREQSCPKCSSARVHRSRARSVTERLLRDWKTERLFRCADCSWRGWLAPLEFPAAAATERVPSPDLASLDAQEGELVGAGSRPFSPRNLG